MKKLFIISGTLLFLVLTFLGVYNFVFKNNSTDPVADPTKKEQIKKDAEIPAQNSNSALQPVIHQAIIGAATDGTSLYYYATNDKALKKSALDGTNIETLFSELPDKPGRLVWSPNRDKVLVFIGNPSPLWYFVDTKAKSIVALKPGMDRLAWTNIGDNIIYEYTDPSTSKNTLNVSDPDGKNWHKIADLGDSAYFLASVPRSSLISYWKRPNGLESTALMAVTLTESSPESLFSGRFGMDFLWSQDGNHILVGSVAEKGSSLLSLGIANDHGGEYRDLLTPTLPSKIVWSGDNQTIFYALPSPFPENSVLPNDYFGKPLYSKDTFWKMDITTGKKERLVALEDMETAVDATNLFLSGDESFLFFTDRESSTLYRIKL